MTRSRPRRATLLAAAIGLLAASCAARRPTQTSEHPVPPAEASITAARPEPLPSAAPQRHVVLIGDSTTFGTPPPKQGAQSPYNPGATLEALLATLEPPPDEGGTAWHRARVHNLAVAASTTTTWLQRPPAGCESLLVMFPVVKRACASQVSWVEAVPMMVEGAPIDAVIVDLGLNDLLITKNPVETVDRLEAIRDMLAPVPVLFFPPIAPRNGPRRDWPERVRSEMEVRGLFSDPQYPPYLPTWDNLHPTHGGYAALGGLWLDGLRKLP